MESKSPANFVLGKQSYLAPDQPFQAQDAEDSGSEAAIDPRVRLMYMANEGDLEGIKELLNSGTDVDFRDIDERTALHVAACQGRTDVVQLLLSRGADVDPKDRWGSTVILFLLIRSCSQLFVNQFTWLLCINILLSWLWCCHNTIMWVKIQSTIQHHINFFC